MNINLIYFSGILLRLIFVMLYFAYGQESRNLCFYDSVPFKKITTTYDILIPFSSTNLQFLSLMKFQYQLIL